MVIAGIIVLCVVLAVLAFLLPRLSRHPQNGAQRTMGVGSRAGSKAPGPLGRLFSKPLPLQLARSGAQRFRRPSGQGTHAVLSPAHEKATRAGAGVSSASSAPTNRRRTVRRRFGADGALRGAWARRGNDPFVTPRALPMPGTHGNDVRTAREPGESAHLPSAGGQAGEGFHLVASHLPTVSTRPSTARRRPSTSTSSTSKPDEGSLGANFPGSSGDPYGGAGGQTGLRHRGDVPYKPARWPRRRSARPSPEPPTSRSASTGARHPNRPSTSWGRPRGEGLPGGRARRRLRLRRRSPHRLRQPTRAARHRAPFRLRRRHARHRGQGRHPALRPPSARRMRAVRAACPRCRTPRRAGGQRQGRRPGRTRPYRDGHRTGCAVPSARAATATPAGSSRTWWRRSGRRWTGTSGSTRPPPRRADPRRGDRTFPAFPRNGPVARAGAGA